MVRMPPRKGEKCTQRCDGTPKAGPAAFFHQYRAVYLGVLEGLLVFGRSSPHVHGYKRIGVFTLQPFARNPCCREWR